MAIDKKKGDKTIYEILGIDPTRRQKKDNQPEEKFEKVKSAEKFDDPSLPSGSIFDKYSSYPEKEQGYWRYFRVLTIVGIVTCVAVIVTAIWGDDIASFKFSKSSYESYSLSSASSSEEYNFGNKDADDEEANESDNEEMTEVAEEIVEEDNSNSIAIPGGTLYFAGKINGKYRVHMELDFDSNSGRYYYDKSGAGNCMQLTISEIRETDNGVYVVLEEYNNDGDYCGEWRGTYYNDTYIGTGDYLGKLMPFNLELCSYYDTDF